MRGIANAALTSRGGAASIRRKMTKERDFGPPPRQAYSGSLLERAANFRGDDAKLAALYQHRRAGVYVIGGESIVLKAQRAPPDPLHMPDEARALEQAARIGLARWWTEISFFRHFAAD